MALDKITNVLLIFKEELKNLLHMKWFLAQVMNPM